VDLKKDTGFMESVLLSSSDLLLSNGRKNQIKVDLLIYQVRTWTFPLFLIAMLSFNQKLEFYQVRNKPSGKYNFAQNKKRKKLKSLLFE